ncbi:hypothetical protein AURDEDRAFT_96824, partial [Auricularia subglabra TFB-10046 SS5]
MGVSPSDSTKLFIQAFLARRTMSDRVARLLYKKCCETVNRYAPADKQVPWNEGRFDSLINAVSGKLIDYDLQISSTFDDVTGRKIWMVVNVKGDELAQLATEYGPAEIAFFKLLIEEIITAPNEAYSISSLHALKLVKQAKTGNKGITRAQGEVVLSSFVANGWLTKSPRGRYALGTRARVELEQYLLSNFEDISEDQECVICTSIVLCGVRCPTAACKARLHNHCHENLSKRGNKECPSCRTNWSNLQLRKIGEGAVGNDDDGHEHRRVRRQQASEDEAEESEEERPARVQRKRGKKPSRATQAEEEDEDDEDEDATQMEVDQEEPEPSTQRRSGRRRG